MAQEDTVPSRTVDPLVAADALAAAETGALIARLEARALRVSGADAAPFLHGQVANDVSGLPVGGVNRSLHLNHRGHAMAEMSVLRLGKDELLVVIDDDRADWVYDSLDSHIIFDQVTLEWRPGTALLTLQGAGAAALLPAVPEAGAFARAELGGAAVTVYARRRSAQGGFDLLLDEHDAAAVVEALRAGGAREADAATIDALRVRGLVPTAAGEGGEGVLPQESGLDGALSYRKGCYLGQEIMARIEARGNLRRALTRLVLDGSPQLEDGDRGVRLEGRVVGRLGSVARLEGPAGAPRVEALAVLRTDLPADAELEVGGVGARLA